MLNIWKKQKSNYKHQYELAIDRPYEPDRNYSQGGRSFYFFDFDDNVAFLPSETYLFHKVKKHQVKISTGEYAKVSHKIGREGDYKDYTLVFDDKKGSYRRFRDKSNSILLPKILHKEQYFVEDIKRALERPEHLWQGPSWSCFYHAVHNDRPISIITARGHSKQTIKDGIKVLVKRGFLPKEPNYLDIYTVSNPKVRKELGDLDFKFSVPDLKKRAIRKAVLQAFHKYGKSPFHRFGMSDDDQNNLKLIMEEMMELKELFPENSFFVINTNDNDFIKEEILKSNSKFGEEVKSQLNLI